MAHPLFSKNGHDPNQETEDRRSYPCKICFLYCRVTYTIQLLFDVRFYNTYVILIGTL